MDKFQELLQKLENSLEKRKYILRTSLSLEKFTSSFIAGLLEIRDPRNSLDITAKVYHHFSAKFTTDMDLL
jgi:hypothetical protein